MPIDEFRCTVTEGDYARAALYVHSETAGEDGPGGALPSRIEIWLVRLLVAIAGAAGGVVLWIWSGSWAITALAAAGAMIGYLWTERTVRRLLARAERALSRAGDRLIERDLHAAVGRARTSVGEGTVRLGGGGVELRFDSGAVEHLRAADVERVIRAEGMTIAVRRGGGAWHERIVPFPDAGLGAGVDPEEVHRALTRELMGHCAGVGNPAA